VVAHLNRLTEASLAEGAAVLAERDLQLGAVVARYGSPPMWERPPGFATLLRIILEQQVSLASAAAAFDRLLGRLHPLTPQSFLTLNGDVLRHVGFSRQKARYGRALAAALVDGSLDLAALDQKSDEDVRAALTTLPGIGPWTADTYLLMALRRPDVWPAGDVALQASVQDLKGLPNRPSSDEMNELAVPWRPWRAVAARVLWFHYLGGRA
jgi:DNA-3-methyladenine glycosylase II